jgi:hypothetical protein
MNSDRSLAAHRRIGRCKRNMTWEEWRQLRRARQVEAKKFDHRPEMSGAMEAYDLNGTRLQHTNCFKYLGNLITPSGNLRQEIGKRVALGRKAIQNHMKVWKSRQTRENIKRALFKVMALSAVLYNCEVLPYSESQLRQLEAWQEEALRVVTRRRRRAMLEANGWVDDMRRKELYTLVKINKIRDIISERRLRWVGHIIRNEDPGTKATYEDHKSDRQNSRWWKMLEEDMRLFGFRDIEQLESLAKDKESWNQKIAYKMATLIPTDNNNATTTDSEADWGEEDSTDFGEDSH